MTGKLDILVNNAIAVTTGSVLEQPLGAWDKVYAVNLRGPVIMIKAFLPGMLERKEGTIVNVLSSEGIAFLAPYSASKAALQSLTSSLVGELGEGTGVIVEKRAYDRPAAQNPIISGETASQATPGPVHTSSSRSRIIENEQRARSLKR